MKNRIRILATSDVHGMIEPYDIDQLKSYQGMARLSTAINTLRDENTILIDNGDLLTGSAMTTWQHFNKPEETSVMTTCINAMGYDYFNLGNHDFDHGEAEVLRHLEKAKAACITTNVTLSGKPIAPTYVVQEINGLKIALFGVVTHVTPAWVRRESVKHFKFKDALESAKHTVEVLKSLEKPDYIICVYHGGFERDLTSEVLQNGIPGENQAIRMIQEIPGIDLLICGHQHKSMAGTLYNTAYTQTKANGSELACIDIYTDTHSIEPRIFEVTDEPDEAIPDLFKEQEEACNAWLNETIGACATDLSIQNAEQARLEKPNFITLLNRIKMEYGGSDLAASCLYTGARGLCSEITIRDLVSSYPFPNTLVVKEITGKQLKDYLEACAGYWTIKDEAIIPSSWVEPYNYDMIDGVAYNIHVSNPLGERVTSITFNGKEITEDQTFTITLTDFRACGNSFEMLTKAKTIRRIQTSVLRILMEYIMRNTPITIEPIHNIIIEK